jgi:hypothetical protein
MKKILSIIAIFIFLGFTAEAKPANPPAGFGIFFSALNPHGQWIEIDYGMVVWRPTVMKRGWAPYTAGHWIWTIDGWYWESYEPFGYVTYHYGRWHYDNYYGWIWVPDYEWAPAWVEWRYDDVYIGWAPLSPYAVFSVNVGIHYTHSYYSPYHHWHFVTYRHFHQPYVYKHFVGAKHKNRIYSRTKYRTNYGYYDGRVVNRGVDIDYVRQRSGGEIRTREIERIRDYSSFERDRSSGRDGGNNDRIRTLYVPKEELQRDRDRDIVRNDIKKAERKTTLDVSKVEIGQRIRNDAAAERSRTNDNSRSEVIEKRDTRSNEKAPVEVRKDSRTEKSNDVREKRSDERMTKPNSNIREGNEVRTNTRPPAAEVKRETRTEVQRKPVETRTNAPEVKRESRTEVQRKPVETRSSTPEVRKREERKSETNVQRNNSPAQKRETQKTETKTEKKSEPRERSTREKTR